jgi:hypothetical protein
LIFKQELPEQHEHLLVRVDDFGRVWQVGVAGRQWIVQQALQCIKNRLEITGLVDLSKIATGKILVTL